MGSHFPSQFVFHLILERFTRLGGLFSVVYSDSINSGSRLHADFFNALGRFSSFTASYKLNYAAHRGHASIASPHMNVSQLITKMCTGWNAKPATRNHQGDFASVVFNFFGIFKGILAVSPHCLLPSLLFCITFTKSHYWSTHRMQMRASTDIYEAAEATACTYWGMRLWRCDKERCCCGERPESLTNDW